MNRYILKFFIKDKNIIYTFKMLYLGFIKYKF